MTDNPKTANALSDAERRRLSALVDTILPASEDGRMPSAVELDFLSYLNAQARGFLPVLREIIGAFGDEFAELPLPARVAVLEAFAKGNAKVFEDLLMRVYDCYYQNDCVRKLIGAPLGPPFPRGNVIPAGDLSGLEAVKKRARGYRR